MLVTTLATALLAAGCTGDPEPVTTPALETPAVTPTPTPSSPPVSDSSVPPERPAAMAEATPDGAAAAATYAIEVLNFAAASGDPAPWQEITAATCRMCSALTESIVESGPDQDAPLVVTGARGHDLATEGLYSVDLTITQEPSEDGTDPGGNFVFFVALSHHDEWVVEAIDTSEA